MENNPDEFLVGAFRRKTQTIVVTFLKPNEVTDFIRFISWLPLTATLMKLLLLIFWRIFLGLPSRRTGSSPVHDQNFFCTGFRLCETFFANFFNVSKASAFIFFYFTNEWKFKNSQRVPFYIFRHYATCRKLREKFGKFFSQFLVGVFEENPDSYSG